MKDEKKNGFQLGDWQIYPLRNILVAPPGEIHIEPKVMPVLEPLFKTVVARVKADNAKMLVECKAGISRDDIIDEDLGELAVFEVPIT